MYNMEREQFRQKARAAYERQLEAVDKAYSQIAADPDAVDEVLNNTPLTSIEDQRVKKVVLSLGGPSFGYLVFFTSDGREWEVDSGCYWYQDSNMKRETFWLEPGDLEKVVEVYGLVIHE